MATGVLSSNTPTIVNTGETRDNQLYRCIVTARYFVDDEKNITQNADNPQVLYDCAVLGGFQEGQTISNCRLASWLGGQFNFAERVLCPNRMPLNEIPLREQDGDIVLVQYIQGQKMAPMIVGMGTQPKDGEATGAKIEDGPRWVEQYNGVETKINKDGEYSLTIKGGELDTENNDFVPAEETQLSSIVMDKDSKVTILAGDATSIVIDGKSDSIVIKNNQGLEINITGASMTINGGTTLTATADTINLDAGMVNVGQGAGLHSTLFENLKSEFESHIHQVPQAMGGILPSQKPLIPLTPSVGSQSVTVKD